MEEVIKGAVQALKEGENCVLVTVVRTKGSTPQKSGAMLLVKEDGSGIGTLGGGCVEGDIWFAATEILQKNTGPEFKDYYLNEDITALRNYIQEWIDAQQPRTTWNGLFTKAGLSNGSATNWRKEIIKKFPRMETI